MKIKLLNSISADVLCHRACLNALKACLNALKQMMFCYTHMAVLYVCVARCIIAWCLLRKSPKSHCAN